MQISSPIEGEVFTSKSIKVSATVELPDDITIQRYTVILDGTPIVVNTQSTDLTYYGRVSGDGNHKVEVFVVTNPPRESVSKTVNFSVSLPDNTKPVITAPADKIVDATGINTIVDIGMAIATDNKDPNPIITNDAPDVFAVGETIVTWTATDASGNTVSATQTITIIPNEKTVFGLTSGSFADNKFTTSGYIEIDDLHTHVITFGNYTVTERDVCTSLTLDGIVSFDDYEDDKIFWTSDSTICKNENNEDQLSGNFIVTNGAGQYVGATGEGTIEYNLSRSKVSGTFEGILKTLLN